MATSAKVLLSIFLVILPLNAVSGKIWPVGRLPNSLTGLSCDSLKRTGFWHNFLYYGNHDARINDVLISTPIGQTTVPGTSRKALLTNVAISWWTADPNSQCAGQFAQTYVTDDGREVMVVYNSDAPNTPISLTSYAMYDDDFMQIRCFCTKPNKKTHMCEEPNFFINTRKRPDQMSPQEKDAVRATAARVLAPYEFNIADFEEEVWTTTKPICAAQPPVCYAGLIDGLTQQFGGPLVTSKVRDGSGGYGGG